jgi:hypothetical protein
MQVLHGIQQRLQKEIKEESDPFNILVYDFKLETVRGHLRWLSRSAKNYIAKKNGHQKRFMSGEKRG